MLLYGHCLLVNDVSKLVTQPVVLTCLGKLWGHRGYWQASQTIDCEVHSRGDKVPRVLIHLLSQILQRQGSWLLIWSMTITAMSACEFASLLKCAARRDSSVLWCVMWNQWQWILPWRGCPVSPTYCWPHLLHIIRYILWLENSSVAIIVGQVLTEQPHTDSCQALHKS